MSSGLQSSEPPLAQGVSRKMHTSLHSTSWYTKNTLSTVRKPVESMAPSCRVPKKAPKSSAPFPHRRILLGGQDSLAPGELAAQLCFSGMVSACNEMAPWGEGTFPVQQLKFSSWQQEMLSSPYLLDLLASMQARCRQTACCLMGAWSLKLFPEFCWDRQDSVNSTPDRESLIWAHFGMLLCACSLPGGCSSKLINFCDLNRSLLLVVPACAVLHSYRWCALSGDPISMPL